MTNIQIKENIITIENEGLKYSFDCNRLTSYSVDVKDYEIEYIFADVKNNYLTVIATVASGQAGIIAVVDISEDHVVHVQNGSFAISAIVSGNKVISFHDIASYGHYPYYSIDVMNLGNMDMSTESNSMKVDYERDFYNGKDTISLSLADAILKISNGNITHTENIVDLL